MGDNARSNMAHGEYGVDRGGWLVPYMGHSDPAAWLRIVRTAAEVNGWTDSKCKSMACAFIQGAADKWLESNRDFEGWSFEEFGKALVKKFSPNSGRRVHRKRGSARARLCYACRKRGHLAKDCPDRATDGFGKLSLATSTENVEKAEIQGPQKDKGEVVVEGSRFSYREALKGWSS